MYMESAPRRSKREGPLFSMCRQALSTADLKVCGIDCFIPPEEQEAEVDKVAGFLEIGRTEDTQEIVIKLPDLKPDARGAARIVLSPRYARHLANLLIENATYAEAEADGMLPKSKHYRKLNRDRKSSESH